MRTIAKIIVFKNTVINLIKNYTKHRVKESTLICPLGTQHI